MSSSKVQTVLGDVSKEELGMVLPHEHLFNDLSSEVAPATYPSTRVLAEAKVAADWQYLLRQDPYSCADNMAEKPVSDVVDEVLAFKRAGGGTVVDATGSASIGRNAPKLRDVALHTGLNIVMSAGPYIEKFEKAVLVESSPQAIADGLIKDLTVGVGSTSIKAGVIGEIGVSPAFTTGEHKSLVAAAIAGRQCPSVGVNVHMPGWQRRGHEVLDILINEGNLPPEKVSLAHSDPSGNDPQYQRSLLDRGVFLEFDMIGLDITFPGEGASPSVSETLKAVAGLIRDGYSEQLLFSHDLFLKQMWIKNGGNGFAFVPTIFRDSLEYLGISAEEVNKILTDNPARWLCDS
ncbi:phosphotriesterase family protein [Corynebacterium flavescens]